MIVRDERTEYRGPDLPAPFGERLQVALGLDECPETFGDWVDAVVRLADRADVDVGLDALCSTEDSPHRATFGGGGHSTTGVRSTRSSSRSWRTALMPSRLRRRPP